MIKLIKPKFNIKTKKYISPAKVKLNIKHEYTPSEILKLATHLTQIAEIANSLNQITMKEEKHDTV